MEVFTMWKSSLCILWVFMILAVTRTAPAAIQLEPVLTGLASPLYVTHAGDGSNRLFILEQAGRIKVLQPGAATPTVSLWSAHMPVIDEVPCKSTCEP
jgi:hypothetical protein